MGFPESGKRSPDQPDEIIEKIKDVIRTPRLDNLEIFADRSDVRHFGPAQYVTDESTMPSTVEFTRQVPVQPSSPDIGPQFTRQVPVQPSSPDVGPQFTRQVPVQPSSPDAGPQFTRPAPARSKLGAKLAESVQPTGAGTAKPGIEPVRPNSGADDPPLIDAELRDDTRRGDSPGPQDGSFARPDRASGKTSPLLEAALRVSGRVPRERESLRQKLAALDAIDPEHIDELNTTNWDDLDDDAKAAANAIWKEAADVVARAVTELNQRREFLDALADWRDDSIREALSEAEVRRRHPLVARFWDAMKELAKDVLRDVVTEVAQAALLEMLFPGAHLILPPTSLVAAIFTAGALGELANGAA